VRAPIVLTASVAAVLAAAPQGHAAFPGKNGLIAFQKIKAPLAMIGQEVDAP
jgi:hypothetical protein